MLVLTLKMSDFVVVVKAETIVFKYRYINYMILDFTCCFSIEIFYLITIQYVNPFHIIYVFVCIA